MYYFLAIVLKDDIAEGNFYPSYVLCKSFTTSTRHSNLVVVNQTSGVPSSKRPRLLVTELYGHDDMIEFMSSYQTVDKNMVHYHPRGGLCWFECDAYGRETGSVVWIKRVPEFRWWFDFAHRGWQQMKRNKEQNIMLNRILANEPQFDELKTSSVKAKLP